MIGYIKKINLKRKQNIIKKRYPLVDIVLHLDMPLSSINKMVEVARTVKRVNELEPEISALTDAQLKEKTGEFRKYIFNKSKEFEAQIQALEESFLSLAIPEEKEKVRNIILFSYSLWSAFRTSPKSSVPFSKPASMLVLPCSPISIMWFFRAGISVSPIFLSGFARYAWSS